MRVVFMGTPKFSVPTLHALASHHDVVGVYTQPDRPVGRGLELSRSPVKHAALELGIPVFQPERLSQPEEWERLKALAPEAIVVVAYGQILRDDVLSLPRLGCINIHASLLPRWRGAAPIQRAVLEGDSETGVCTMKMVRGLDAGDVLESIQIPILPNDTSSTLQDRLSAAGAPLILSTLEGLSRGILKGIPQDETRVTYAQKLTKDLEYLSPTLSAPEVSRRVRALYPWPGTCLWLETPDGIKRLKIKEVGEVLSNRTTGAQSPSLEVASPLVLLTTKGAIELRRVQWDGKKEVDSVAFLSGARGHRWPDRLPWVKMPSNESSS